MNTILFHPKWKYGRPAELFANKESFIHEFIEKNGLSPVQQETLAQLSTVQGGVIIDGMHNFQLLLNEPQYGQRKAKSVGAATVEREEPVELPLKPFPGGLRSPHIHFRGEVYLLNDKEWQRFCKPIVSEIMHKLEKAESIGFGFESLLELSEAANILPHGAD